MSIEATVVNPDDAADEKVDQAETRIAKARRRLRMALLTFRQNLKSRLKSAGKSAFVFLKTKAKEYALYSFVMVKILLKKAATPLRLFREASNAQRYDGADSRSHRVGGPLVLMNNLRGIWIPGLNEPILADLRSRADWVEEFDTKEGVESFYSAFPQERHEFLFSRMKVNLRATSDSPNPMAHLKSLSCWIQKTPPSKSAIVRWSSLMRSKGFLKKKPSMT